jgi:hypothetical protein
LALDGFQGGEPAEQKYKELNRQYAKAARLLKRELRERMQRKAGIFLFAYLSPLLANWRLGGSILRWI